MHRDPCPPVLVRAQMIRPFQPTGPMLAMAVTLVLLPLEVKAADLNNPLSTCGGSSQYYLRAVEDCEST